MAYDPPNNKQQFLALANEYITTDDTPTTFYSIPLEELEGFTLIVTANIDQDTFTAGAFAEAKAKFSRASGGNVVICGGSITDQNGNFPGIEPNIDLQPDIATQSALIVGKGKGGLTLKWVLNASVIKSI